MIRRIRRAGPACDDAMPDAPDRVFWERRSMKYVLKHKDLVGAAIAVGLLSSVSVQTASSHNSHNKPPAPPSTIVDSKGAYVASLLGTNDLARLVNGTWVNIANPFQPE